MRGAARFVAGLAVLAVAALVGTVILITPLWWFAVETPTVYAVATITLTLFLVIRTLIRKRSKSAENQNR